VKQQTNFIAGPVYFYNKHEVSNKQFFFCIYIMSVVLQKHSKSNSHAPLSTGQFIWKITEG
jgi:hypothetical protein